MIANSPPNAAADDIWDEDDNDTKMPPKLKTTGAAKTPVAPPATPLESLTGRMDKLRVKEVKPFSFDVTVPTMTKEYCKNNRDKVEVEFISHPMGKDFFDIGLSDDGMEATIKVATPSLMGEEKRMKHQMGGQYRQNDPRALVHAGVVQKIRTKSKAKNGKHWGDPQSVMLPAKCEGPPVKKWTYLPNGYVDVPGPAGNVRHTQFVLVVSIFFNVAKKRVAKEKVGKVVILQALSLDSDDSDVDSDDDDEEEEEDDGMNP